MLPFSIIFAATLALTVISGATATAIVVFGDTRRNAGQKAVAERLAQIALVGATAVVALAKFPE